MGRKNLHKEKRVGIYLSTQANEYLVIHAGKLQQEEGRLVSKEEILESIIQKVKTLEEV